MSARSVCQATFVVVFILAASSAIHADIHRWDTGEVIPGTKGLEPRPGMWLEGRNRESLNLRYADFSGGPNLANATFRFSWLDDADFSGANLTNASFESSRCPAVDFSNTDLSGARMSLATLTGAILAEAVVTGADFWRTTAHGFMKEQLYSTASYREGNLRGIRLGANDLSNWDFGGQDLTNALFVGCEPVFGFCIGSRLTDANLTGANLRTASFERSDLSSAIMDATTVYDQWTLFPTEFDPSAAGITLVLSPAGDFDANDALESLDVDVLAARIRSGYVDLNGFWPNAMFDLNDDQSIDLADHRFWVKVLKRTWYGDANLDGKFNTLDFVQTLEAGKYEKGWLTERAQILGESASWSEGDWNGDGVFDTGDLVIALEDGGYAKGP